MLRNVFIAPLAANSVAGDVTLPRVTLLHCMQGWRAAIGITNGEQLECYSKGPLSHRLRANNCLACPPACRGPLGRLRLEHERSERQPKERLTRELGTMQKELDDKVYEYLYSSKYRLLQVGFWTIGRRGPCTFITFLNSYVSVSRG